MASGAEAGYSKSDFSYKKGQDNDELSMPAGLILKQNNP